MEIFIITGQTATGKTARSLELARLHDAEIINFDSRQIYKHLDIVTGKDIESPVFKKTSNLNGFDIGYYLLRDIPVWLYDIADPKTYFSSFDFTTCALSVLEDLKRRHKNAVLTGGTYLYLYHLLYDVETGHIPPDTTLRKALNNRTVPDLQSALRTLDPDLFKSLNNSEQNNPQRLIRKIEIAEFYRKQGKNVPVIMQYNYRKLPGEIAGYTGLVFGKREAAREAIQARVAKRMKEGAVEEVRRLMNAGYGENDPGLRTIGYKELLAYVRQEQTREEMEKLWITHELQYTKRQLTFMKKDPHIRWESV